MVRKVLSTPGVARIFASSLVGRIPGGALGILLILRLRELGGGYAGGGIVAGAFALGSGAAAPLVGRLVDARGQTRILLPSAATSAGALVALALAPTGTPLVALLALAAIAGGASPPLAACLRALWPVLLTDAARRHAAYALESAALEISYILGPLVLVGVVAVHSAALALATCAVLLTTGSIAFAATPASRAWIPATGVRRGLAGALSSPGVRTLLVALAFIGTSFGAIEVAVVAFAEHADAPGAIGPLLSGWGLASMVGGAIAIRLGPPRAPVRRLVALLAALAATDALLLAASSPLALGVLLIVAGAAIAPVFAIVYTLAGDVAREGTVTEAFTWLSTGIAIGLATGSAAGGALAASGGARAGFVAAAVGATLAALTVRARAGDLVPVADAEAAEAAPASTAVPAGAG